MAKMKVGWWNGGMADEWLTQ